MPHLNLNWAGVTTLSMRTCCKAVSGECLCDALSWSALPTPSGRTGNTKTTDYCHPAAPGFTDTVCLRNILWGLGAINKTLQALSQCTATSLRLDGKNLHWRRMWKEVHILFQYVVTVHELPGWVEGRYLKLTSSWSICGSMLYSLVWAWAWTA